MSAFPMLSPCKKEINIVSAAFQPQQITQDRKECGEQPSSRAARGLDEAYYDRKLDSSAIQGAVRGDINQWRANYDTTLSCVSAGN